MGVERINDKPIIDSLSDRDTLVITHYNDDADKDGNVCRFSVSNLHDSTKLNKNLGEEYKDKLLGIDATGEILPIDKPHIPEIDATLSESGKAADAKIVGDGLKEKVNTVDIPNALPNPYPLNFTGALTDTYDGSVSKTINIPVQDADLSGKTVTFTESSADSELISGDTLSILFGKIKKKFSLIKTDITSLKNKIIGATNILNATNELATLGATAQWANRTWRNSKSGDSPEGTSAAISIDDAPNPHIKYGFELNTVSGRIMVAQDGVPLNISKTYTLSCYARTTNGTGKLVLQVGAGSGWNAVVKDVTDGWQKYYITFAAKTNTANAYFGNDGANSTLQVCGCKLEVGDCATDWSYSPDDLNNRVSILDNKKLDKSKIVSSLDITESGFVADAKVIADKFAELNSNLNSIPVIDSGKITATVTKAAVTNITIPFSKEFSVAPILTFSWITSQMTADVFVSLCV